MTEDESIRKGVLIIKRIFESNGTSLNIADSFLEEAVIQILRLPREEENNPYQYIKVIEE